MQNISFLFSLNVKILVNDKIYNLYNLVYSHYIVPWKNMKSTVKSVARISLQKLFFEHQIDWLETSHACIDLLLIRPNIIIGKMLDIPRCQIHQQRTFTDYNAIISLRLLSLKGIHYILSKYRNILQNGWYYI